MEKERPFTVFVSVSFGISCGDEGDSERMSSVNYSDKIQKWFGWGNWIFDIFWEADVIDGFCSDECRLTGRCTRESCG